MNWTPAKVSEYPSQAAEHIQNLEAVVRSMAKAYSKEGTEATIRAAWVDLRDLLARMDGK